MSEPILGYAECSACHHEWTAFLPDGIDPVVDANAKIECPKCHQAAGWLLDEENSFYREHPDADAS